MCMSDDLESFVNPIQKLLNTSWRHGGGIDCVMSSHTGFIEDILSFDSY